MTFQFKFEGGYVRGKRSNGELLPDAPGFVPNSGVYIYNAIEVAIFDTNALLDILDTVEADGTVRIKAPGSRTDTFWKVLTGVPYGVASETREGYDESWLKTKNPLKPAGQWNEMEIRFEPLFRNGEPIYDHEVLIWYKLTVTVNGHVTYSTVGHDQDGTKIDKDTRKPVETLEIKPPWYIYLQSHWGSRVSFRNMVIKTGQDIPDK